MGAVNIKLSASYKSGFSNIAILSDYYNSKPSAGEYYNFVYIESIATAPRKKIQILAALILF